MAQGRPAVLIDSAVSTVERQQGLPRARLRTCHADIHRRTRTAAAHVAQQAPSKMTANRTLPPSRRTVTLAQVAGAGQSVQTAPCHVCRLRDTILQDRMRTFCATTCRSLDRSFLRRMADIEEDFSKRTRIARAVTGFSGCGRMQGFGVDRDRNLMAKDPIACDLIKKGYRKRFREMACIRKHMFRAHYDATCVQTTSPDLTSFESTLPHQFCTFFAGKNLSPV